MATRESRPRKANSSAAKEATRSPTQRLGDRLLVTEQTRISNLDNNVARPRKLTCYRRTLALTVSSAPTQRSCAESRAKLRLYEAKARVRELALP